MTISPKVNVILTTPGVRAQLQAVDSRIKDYLQIIPGFTFDLRLKRHYQTGID